MKDAKGYLKTHSGATVGAGLLAVTYELSESTMLYRVDWAD